MSQPIIAIVGSGPIGSAYARVLIEQHPGARVVMFEAGPQLTGIPGESVRNIQDPEAKAQAREKSQGPQAGAYRAALGIPEATVTEGMFTARQGTHLLDFGGPGSAHAPSFPAAAAATNVGGQGAHWTCATPEPAFSEKIPFIPEEEWESLMAQAKGLLHVQGEAFADSAVGGAIRSLLDEEFGAELPDGYGVGTLPVAGDPQEDGSMRWAGADVVLGPLIEPRSEQASRFELRDLSLVLRIELEGQRATGVSYKDLRTGQISFFAADAVVVAADAFRSPQLLWASGIRHRARPGSRTCPPGVEPGGPGGGGQPHSVLRTRAPVLRAGDVFRIHSLSDGSAGRAREQPMGLRQHGLRHAQAAAVRRRGKF